MNPFLVMKSTSDRESWPKNKKGRHAVVIHVRNIADGFTVVFTSGAKRDTFYSVIGY